MIDFSEWVKPLIILTPMVVVGITYFVIYLDGQDQKKKDLASKTTVPPVEEKEEDVIVV